MKNTTNLCDAIKFSSSDCPMKVGVHILGISFFVPMKTPRVSCSVIIVGVGVGVDVVLNLIVNLWHISLIWVRPM